MKRFAEYKAFSEETGVAVMLQEFGVSNLSPYGMTLEYLNDLLDAIDESGISWCSWDYIGDFSFYYINGADRREGATYEKFLDGWIATEMRDLYLAHMTR